MAPFWWCWNGSSETLSAMQRYKVTQLPDWSAWAILDLDAGAYCTLPDAEGPHPNLLPVEFRTRAAAEAWLHRCYVAWQAELVPPPVNWRPLPPGPPSPWA